MKVEFIVVAAGSGTRFNSKTPKPFVRLKGQSLIGRILQVAERCPCISRVVIVGHPDHLSRFCSLQKKFKKVGAVVPGGASRAASVKRGLEALSPAADTVLVHDAARPLIDEKMICDVVAALRRHKAAVLGVPVKATIKRADPKTLLVKETPPRHWLWEIQTPQGFNRRILTRAHDIVFDGEATDCAMLVERLKVPVKVVEGSYRNLKITTPEDLEWARALLKK